VVQREFPPRVWVCNNVQQGLQNRRRKKCFGSKRGKQRRKLRIVPTTKPKKLNSNFLKKSRKNIVLAGERLSPPGIKASKRTGESKKGTKKKRKKMVCIKGTPEHARR